MVGTTDIEIGLFQLISVHPL